MPAAGIAIGTVQVLTAQAAAFAAALLIASAIHKVVDWPVLKSVVQGFAGVPTVLAAPAVAAAALVESSAGVLLLFQGPRSVGAALAFLIWAVYLGLIVRAIVQGRRDAACGCGFGPTHRPLGFYQLARNGLLLGLSASLIVGSHIAGGLPIEGSQVLAALALLALYGALDQVMGLGPLRAGEVA